MTDTDGGLEKQSPEQTSVATTSVTQPWLKDAYYTFNPMAILPYLDVHVPNAATDKHWRYRGKQQCDLVRCLLDALGIPGTTEYHIKAKKVGKE